MRPCASRKNGFSDGRSDDRDRYQCVAAHAARRRPRSLPARSAVPQARKRERVGGDQPDRSGGSEATWTWARTYKSRRQEIAGKVEEILEPRHFEVLFADAAAR